MTWTDDGSNGGMRTASKPAGTNTQDQGKECGRYIETPSTRYPPSTIPLFVTCCLWEVSLYDNFMECGAPFKLQHTISRHDIARRRRVCGNQTGRVLEAAMILRQVAYTTVSCITWQTCTYSYLLTGRANRAGEGGGFTALYPHPYEILRRLRMENEG